MRPTLAALPPLRNVSRLLRSTATAVLLHGPGCRTCRGIGTQHRLNQKVKEDELHPVPCSLCLHRSLTGRKRRAVILAIFYAQGLRRVAPTIDNP